MLKINIEISTDAMEGLTELEQSILNTLSGAGTKTIEVGEVRVTEPVKAAAPAAKEEAPKRTRRTKAEIEADKKAAAAAKAPAEEPEDEPKSLQEELAEDEPADDAEDDVEALRNQVVAKVTTMVSKGGAVAVREALQSIGAKKVSGVQDKDLGALLDALDEKA